MRKSTSRTRNYRPGTSRNVVKLASFKDQMAAFARAERLRELRDERHLGREKVAAEIGVSTKTVFSWENGGGIRWPNAEKLAAFYGVEPEELASLRKDGSQPHGGPVGSQLDIRRRLDHLDALMEANHAMLNTLLHALGMTDKDIDEANRVSLETLRSLGRTEAPAASTTTRRAARRARG